MEWISIKDQLPPNDENSRKKDLIEILRHMNERLNSLPNHVKNEFVTNRDLYAFTSLIEAILMEHSEE